MDNELFERRVLECESTLYRVSVSILKNDADAQDAVHDAILIAFEKRHTLRDPGAFTPWLLRILVRVCYKELRRRSRFADVGEQLSNVPGRENPYEDLLAGEMLNALPVAVRTVIILHYVEGYSVKEVAGILRIPEGTVKSRLSTGRGRLKEAMAKADRAGAQEPDA